MSVPRLLGQRYRLGRRIGSGSFGEIFLGSDVNTGQEVAIKLEPTTSAHSQLLYEAKLYRVLQGGDGIPLFHTYFVEGTSNVMIIELLGPNLEDLFNFCGRRFCLKTVVLLADQILQRLEYVHSKCFLHRDLKPDNFLVGLGSSAAKVFCIDFGLAKRYRDPRSGDHIPMVKGKNLTGTARYASINTHDGLEQSRRDDLESWCYVVIYFLKGGLPWQGTRGVSKQQKYDRIAERKRSLTAAELCSTLPDEFTALLSYSRSLAFEAEPDYALMHSLLRKVALKHNFEFDAQFEWNRKRNSADGPLKPVVSTHSPSAATSHAHGSMSIDPLVGMGSPAPTNHATIGSFYGTATSPNTPTGPVSMGFKTRVSDTLSLHLGTAGDAILPVLQRLLGAQGRA